MKTASSTKFSRVMGIGLCTATIACLVPLPASASPPTPREVARHVHNRVSGLFFKIARTLEGDPGPRERRRAESDRERYEREMQYEEDYAYNDGYEYERGPRGETGVRNPRRNDDYIAPPPPVDRREDPRNYGSGSSRDTRTNDGRRVVPSPNPENPNLALRNRDRVQDSSSSTVKPPQPQVNDRTGSSRGDNDVSREGSVNRGSRSDSAPTNTGSGSGDAQQKTAKYAVPVPNKSGFVYPPGAKQTTENMLDVRGLEPGQKARDPRTGDVFLVP